MIVLNLSTNSPKTSAQDKSESLLPF